MVRHPHRSSLTDSAAPGAAGGAGREVAEASSRSLGERWHESNEVNEAVGSIIAAMRRHQAEITGVRGPIDKRSELRYEQMLKDAASVRGKSKLFYDYVGSGLGRGPYVELADGSVKLDMINGIGVHFFGHSDEETVRAALRGAMSDTIMQGNLQANDEATRFAELLVREAGRTSDIKHAFLTNSGAMANESALKICYQKRAPAGRVLAFDHCFMGRSTTMAQIGDSAANRVGLPLTVQVDYLPFFDPDLGLEASLERAMERLEEHLRRYPCQHASFIFEPVQGEGGFNVAPREFLLPLIERVRAHEVPVWSDEVQTFGRTTSMFAFEMLGLGEYVDVVSIGKMPQVCAILFTEAMNPKAGLLSGTFIGSSAGLRAGLRCLERLRDGDYYGDDGRIAQHHARFRAGIEAIAERHPECFGPVEDGKGRRLDRLGIVGGVGGMMRFTPFGGKRERVSRLLQTLFREGVIAFTCGHGPYHVRFLPPLGIMEPEHWEPVFEITERALVKVAESSG